MRSIESLREKCQFALVCVIFAFLMHPGTLFNDSAYAHSGDDTEHPEPPECEDDPDCTLPTSVLSFYKLKDCSDNPKHFHDFAGAKQAGYEYYKKDPCDKDCLKIKF